MSTTTQQHQESQESQEYNNHTLPKPPYNPLINPSNTRPILADE